VAGRAVRREELLTRREGLRVRGLETTPTWS
jgi:hypothetical protein